MSKEIGHAEALELVIDRITGPFENTGKKNIWQGIARPVNFDGCGPSMGCLQFAFGVGGLQPLLKWIDKRSNLETFFRESHAQALRRVMKLPIAAQKGWANQLFFNHTKRWIAWPGGGGWRDEFVKLSRSPLFKLAQLHGAKKYQRRADKLVNACGIYTLRAFALFFDIAVQNGGVRMSTREEIRILRRETRKTLGRRMTETERLRNWARVRASKSKEKYRGDVLSRKITIVNQRGVVHGRQFNFNHLGLERIYCPS